MSELSCTIKLSRGSFSLDVALSWPLSGINVIAGASGSGKSSLLRCLAGLEKGDGRIAVNDRVWQDSRTAVFLPPAARRIGMVLQDASLFPHLDVGRNLIYGLNRCPAAQCKIEQNGVVELLNLQPLLSRYPAQLSGGERQRVAIGRALLAQPELLLMDEPLTGLDWTAKRSILMFLRSLPARFGVPIVYVSHSLGEMLELADMVTLLQQGRVARTGPAVEVLRDAGAALQDEREGVVLDTVVADHEPAFELTKLAFGSAFLYLPQIDRRKGERVRLFVPAVNVMLGVNAPQPGLSVLNVLQGTVLNVVASGSESHTVLVNVDVGAPLLARITKKSAADLALRTGTIVYCYVKAASLADMLS